MGSIVISGSTSGAITVSAPAEAGTNTISLPASTSTLATTTDIAGPAFRATTNGTAQSISAATHTKILYATEVFDTNNDYNVSDSVFTPTVAGYYQVSAGIYIAGAQTRCLVSLYKNSSAYSVLSDMNTSLNNFTNSGSVLVEMNGTDDTLSVYVFTTQTSIGGGDASRLWFTSHLARPA